MATAAPPDQQGAYPSLLTALCARDAYTRGHCDRVCTLALALGRRLDLCERDLDALRLASQLHDIGKIGVRDDVLYKRGRLDPAEWDEMKAHAIHGERIVNQTYLSNRAEVAAIVRHHHEAFDGSGYPDGLSQAAIPRASRILLVVDAYDAMTSGRPYRAPRSHAEAIGIIAGEAGTQLDPAVVAAFVDFANTPPWRESDAYGDPARPA
ncbi:MAG: HD-GYP domain-containing protein [Lysobacteraceae bacterium]|nr:MAG: HD-GYP domain-containing protein [Xanthomonadaceae bacterium]